MGILNIISVDKIFWSINWRYLEALSRFPASLNLCQPALNIARSDLNLLIVFLVKDDINNFP